MKRGSLFFFTAIILLSACKKDDDFAFDKSPDERINEALAAYQTKLAGAENGWKGLITVDSGRGVTYSFYFKFNDQNRVTMVSDFDSSSAATPKESSFRLKAQQQMTLIFDTYSYVHVLADPNEGVAIDADHSLIVDVNSGPLGAGLLSDFEFIFDNSQVKDDTIRMNGKVHGAKLVLVKATKTEADTFLGGQFSLFSDFLNNKILTYFKRFTLGNQLYDVALNETTRTITFTWVNGAGAPQSFTTGYYNIIGGLQLIEPFTNGSQTISTFSNAVWDANSSTLSLNAGGQAGTIKPIVIPLFVDKQAPRRWWQYGFDQDNYWISLNGFHVNGVDDAFDIRSLTSGTSTYYYLIYWPGYNPGSNDLFAPIFLNAAHTALELKYGAAPATPNFTTDGRAIFTLLGNYGTYPLTGPARLTRDQLLIPEGYYFVQISETEYDMVSAADGLAWVKWIW